MMNQITPSARWVLFVPALTVLFACACSSDTQSAAGSAGNAGTAGSGSSAAGGTAVGGSNASGSGGAGAGGVGGSALGSGGALAAGGASAGGGGASGAAVGGSNGAGCQSGMIQATNHGGLVSPLKVGSYCDNVFICFSSAAEASAAAAVNPALDCGNQTGEVACPRAQSCEYRHPSTTTLTQADLDGLCSVLSATNGGVECFVVGPR